MIEHEYVHVFKASYENQKINPDPSEVVSCDWKTPLQIRQEIKALPHKYAAWFMHYMDHHYDDLFSHLTT